MINLIFPPYLQKFGNTSKIVVQYVHVLVHRKDIGYSVSVFYLPVLYFQ